MTRVGGKSHWALSDWLCGTLSTVPAVFGESEIHPSRSATARSHWPVWWTPDALVRWSLTVSTHRRTSAPARTVCWRRCSWFVCLRISEKLAPGQKKMLEIFHTNWLEQDEQCPVHVQGLVIVGLVHRGVQFRCGKQRGHRGPHRGPQQAPCKQKSG